MCVGAILRNTLTMDNCSLQSHQCTVMWRHTPLPPYACQAAAGSATHVRTCTPAASFVCRRIAQSAAPRPPADSCTTHRRQQLLQIPGRAHAHTLAHMHARCLVPLLSSTHTIEVCAAGNGRTSHALHAAAAAHHTLLLLLLDAQRCRLPLPDAREVVLHVCL